MPLIRDTPPGELSPYLEQHRDNSVCRTGDASLARSAGALRAAWEMGRTAYDTFDWYSPKYQSKHTYEQVFKWYEAMGMEDMRVGEISIAVRGRKPARG